MTQSLIHERNYRRELGGGLVLRWSTPADTERLVELYTTVFRNKEADPPSPGMKLWVRDLLSGRHPLITGEDFALVEDTDRRIIVAATCLIQQPVDFGGIPIAMGRPEIVATHAEYRNRGMIRAVFELIHARSAARGHQFQAITGIEYYYRQFGYEYASTLGGGRSVAFIDIPKLKEGVAEPYTLRDATSEDLPTIIRLYEYERTFPRRHAADQLTKPPLVTTAIPESYWRWLLHGASDGSGDAWKLHMIVNGDGQSVGYIVRSPLRGSASVALRGMMVEAGVSLVSVLPSVLRGFQALAPQLPTSRADVPPASKIGLYFFAGHPALEAAKILPTHDEGAYAWYIRVPNLPEFVRTTAPVLEQRLAQSVLAGHSGELRMEFYRGGLRLVFENGRLTTAEDWSKPLWEPEPQAGFPPLIFLQLLFGYRSLADLRKMLPDVWVSNEVVPLIEALFPPQSSWLVPLD